MTVDHATLSAIFASRVKLAKKNIEQVLDDAALEYHRTLAWIKSSRTAEGSFLWMCDEFDLDASAVRRAIREKKQ